MAKVHFRDAFVEVPDDSVLLQDIRQAFGVPSGVIRVLGTDQVVVTLPFESLPRFDCEYELFEIGVTQEQQRESEMLQKMLEIGAGPLLDAEQDSWPYRCLPVSDAFPSLFVSGSYDPRLTAKQTSIEERWRTCRSSPYTSPHDTYTLREAPQSIPSGIERRSDAETRGILHSLRSATLAAELKAALSAEKTEQDVKFKIAEQ